MIPIILEKQKNIRDLGETVTLDGRSIKRNKLIRCGRLSDLSAADAAVLLGTYRVRTVVDLRSAKESEERPDPQWGIVNHSRIPLLHEIQEDIVHQEVRRLIAEDKVRPDGRKIDEIRPLDAQVDILGRRVHGSAMFTRGQTQVISTTTLGPLSDKQVLDDLTAETEKRFMHHYNFPQWCVGGTGKIGVLARREIGHGALGERALSYVIPSEEDFPYTIRTVSEVVAIPIRSLLLFLLWIHCRFGIRCWLEICSDSQPSKTLKLTLRNKLKIFSFFPPNISNRTT